MNKLHIQLNEQPMTEVKLSTSKDENPNQEKLNPDEHLL